MSNKLISVISSPWTHRVMAVGFVSDSIVGFKDCQISKPPMIYERAIRGAYLGIMWSGLTQMTPFIMLASIEGNLKGREFSVLEPFKRHYEIVIRKFDRN